MRSELDRAYKLFVKVADRQKRIEDEDLIEILSSAAPHAFEAASFSAVDQADGFASIIPPPVHKSLGVAGD